MVFPMETEHRVKRKALTLCKEHLRKIVAETLNIPLELSLTPTFIKEFILKKKIASVLSKISRQSMNYKISFFPFKLLQRKNDTEFITSGEPQFNLLGILAPQGYNDESDLSDLKGYEIPIDKVETKVFDIYAADHQLFSLYPAAIGQLNSSGTAVFNDNFIHLAPGKPLTTVLVEDTLVSMSHVVRSPFNAAYFATKEEREEKYGDSRG